MAKSFDDFIKRISDPNINEKIAKLVQPKMESYFKESVGYAIQDFYNSYNPIHYVRTYNFANIADNTRTFQFGNIIQMQASSIGMDAYEGYKTKKGKHMVLNADTAFDFFYNQGEHGHGWNLKAVSTPPTELVEKDIVNGFDGKIYKDIENAISKILS